LPQQGLRSSELNTGGVFGQAQNIWKAETADSPQTEAADSEKQKKPASL
jgi:hypothetical protein